MSANLPQLSQPPRSGSKLEMALREGRFAITCELASPDSCNPEDVLKEAEPFARVALGINCTDGASANSHISSIGASAILALAGYEPVFQMNCRDRNRIAIQSDLISAAALGVKNVLIMTGDDVSAGDQPGAKRVYDLGSAQLIRTAKIMRDQGVFLSGRKIATPPRLFIGAADNPFIPPYEFRPQRLAHKVEAGANFIQTQYCFDLPIFREHMRIARDMGLLERTFILVGVGPLRSERVAEYMRTKVPGIWIPDPLVERMTQTPKNKKRQEGIAICVEIIEQVREIEGVRGIHIMAYGMEKSVEEIVERAGLSAQ